MRRSLRLAIGVVVVATAGLSVLAWRSSSRAIHPTPGVVPWSLADHPELRAEPVTVHSPTGVDLAGRFFAGADPATVVLTHGYGANQDEMLPVAAALHAAGLSVFTYDTRGAGASGGEVTFGTLEQRDIGAVVDHLAARDDVDPQRIGAFGFSLGGASTLLAAAGDPRIRAVVADSAWSDVEHWLTPRLSDVVLHPADPFSPLALKLVELRTETRLGDLHPRREVGRISPRPVLFIHGQADEAVPARDSELNYAAAREPKQLWLLPGARHGDSMRPGGASSSERVTSFFRQALEG